MHPKIVLKQIDTIVPWYYNHADGIAAAPRNINFDCNL